jgi:hypothetical protein
MTKTCGFAALAEGVGTWTFCVGSAGAGPLLGTAFGGACDGDIAAGEAHATTNATTVVRRRARIRSTLSHRDVHAKPSPTRKVTRIEHDLTTDRRAPGWASPAFA